MPSTSYRSRKGPYLTEPPEPEPNRKGLTASQFLTLGDLPILVGGGVKYWVESTDTDPEGLSLNLNLYLLFPK
jgi:hypothetical protein